MAAAAPGAPALAGLAPLLARGPAAADRAARAAAVPAAAAGAALGVAALARGGDVARGSWYMLDAAGGAFLLAIAAVGLMAALASPAYLRGHVHAGAGALRSRRRYHAGLFLFWAALTAVPVVDNLGVAWLLVEATTAASALLVAFSGSPRALEAGWKYLVLTSIGLTAALLGVFVLHAGAAGEEPSVAALDWDALAAAAPGLDRDAALAAFVLIVAGLGTKVGWAPVHNWLPDAHSEAPPPVSALLSAALLPTVALVAWRVDIALREAVPQAASSALFIGFGLASLAVAVPFLWKSLAWKRFLAYSSLEHMGVIALAIGLHHPLATAGALLHVGGHALAKTLGFLAADPLLRYQPAAARRPPRGVARTSRSLGVAVGVSLGSLGGLPPSPLFFSEVLVLLGGIAAGQLWVSAVAAMLLALGFLGVAHMALEALGGRPTGRRPSGPRQPRRIAALSGAALAGLAALSLSAYALPGSALVQALTGVVP
jgi:hydrogenase-4 component F